MCDGTIELIQMRSASRKVCSLSGLASESRTRTSMIMAVYIAAADTPNRSSPSAVVWRLIAIEGWSEQRPGSGGL